MVVLSRIKDLLRERKISIRDFAKEIGITEQGLQLLIRQNSTKVETLEKIAHLLDVPISTFFDEKVESKTNDSSSKEERLLSIIESQQRTIENLTKK